MLAAYEPVENISGEAVLGNRGDVDAGYPNIGFSLMTQASLLSATPLSLTQTQTHIPTTLSAKISRPTRERESFPSHVRKH